MKVEMIFAKKRLAFLWILFSSIVFILLIYISAAGKFHNALSELWGWFLQNTTPILTLIIGALVVDAKSRNSSKVIERFYFRICSILSIVYFVLIVLTVFLIPMAQKQGDFTPIEFIHFSNIYLGPFQGFVTAALGIFFVKSEDNSAAIES